VAVSVLVENLNVIVRVSTLARKYPGGLAQFRRDCLNASFCCDGLLARFGSPARSDVDVFIDRLRERGLVMADEFGFRDMAVVDEFRGLPAGCFWLQTGTRPDGIGFAYKRGTDPSALIAVPPGWSLRARSGLEGARVTGEPWGQMIFIRRDGESDVYLNRRTGEEVRIARRLLTGRGGLLN
jgi:hypothetical protein